MSKAALEGIKIIEFATMVSGPYCGKLLADMGADVIKIESPEGDPARMTGPYPNDVPHPEKSGLFLYNNTNKRGMILDLSLPDDLESFIKLIQWADILIDNHPPHILEDFGLDWDSLHHMNPKLIYTSITPYGRSGPRHHVKGDELTLIHAGGIGNLLPTRAENVDRAPVKLGGYQVAYHGGIAAALATLAVATGPCGGGEGRIIDISLQEVILALVSPLVTSNRYHNSTWSRVPDRPPSMGRMETSDGYVVLGAADDHHFRAFRELMGKPEWASGDEWDNRFYRMNHLMDIAPQMNEWMKKQKKHELHHSAEKKGIPVGPINSAKDVMENAQYRARDYFVEVDHPVAGKYKYAGWAYKMSASPPQIKKPAPLLGQHNEDLRNDPAIFGGKARITISGHQNKAAPSQGSPKVKLPLEGIRVLDFSWVWAGPYTCMLLGVLGAEVIKIEGHKRSDLTRRGVIWPLPDPIPTMLTPNQALGNITINQNKKSLTLDLSRPEGVNLAKRLVAMSDAVIDNMRPGAMIKLGLGYEDLRKIRSDIIVMTLSSRGYGGPETDYLGFATIHQSVGGLAYISGYPDEHPTPGSAGDADLMNAMSTAFITVAALHHRAQSGEGQFIDYSQCEGVTSLLGEIMLGYQMTSQIPERMGNAHPKNAPHSVYRCWGVDRWLALEIHSDEEFIALAKIMGQPHLAEDPRFKTMVARKKHETGLDRIIGEWIRQRDRDWMVEEFCRAGIAAAPCRDGRDLYADRHLQAREAFQKLIHPEWGELEMIRPPWKISDLETPLANAPLLGQHNDYVIKDLLGLTEEEFKELQDKEIIMPESQRGKPLEK